MAQAIQVFEIVLFMVFLFFPLLLASQLLLTVGAMLVVFHRAVLGAPDLDTALGGGVFTARYVPSATSEPPTRRVTVDPAPPEVPTADDGKEKEALAIVCAARHLADGAPVKPKPIPLAQGTVDVDLGSYLREESPEFILPLPEEGSCKRLYAAALDGEAQDATPEATEKAFTDKILADLVAAGLSMEVRVEAEP